MSQNDYIIRTIKSRSEISHLKEMYTKVFHPEEVGRLTETLFNHFPYSDPRYWFVAEEKSTSQLAAGLTLIPWTWNYEGIQLKTAEMGIVGTLPEHRKKGLIKMLNEKFSETLKNEAFHITVIQGIPGFYHRMGYHYGLPLDNHINIPFNVIKDMGDETCRQIRPCDSKDIPWLMEQDRSCKKRYSITSERDAKHWEYIFTHGPDTECASEFSIIEQDDIKKKYYFRVNLQGFGTGLIVSEISEDISHEGLMFLFTALKKIAIERNKPYIRLNISAASEAARLAFTLGAVQMRPYGWQIKICDVILFLKSIQSVLEKRISQSRFRSFTGALCLNLYTSMIILRFSSGLIESIFTEQNKEVQAEFTLSITEDIFIPLVMGFRSVKELRHIRPDVFFEDELTGEFTDILFPKKESWINSQY